MLLQIEEVKKAAKKDRIWMKQDSIHKRNRDFVENLAINAKVHVSDCGWLVG